MDLSQIAMGGSGEGPEMAFLQGMGHTYLWKDGYEWRAVRDKSYTYARYLVDSKELLFNHAEDPLQVNDLSDDPAFADVKQRMKSFMEQQRRPIPPATPSTPPVQIVPPDPDDS